MVLFGKNPPVLAQFNLGYFHGDYLILWRDVTFFVSHWECWCELLWCSVGRFWCKGCEQDGAACFVLLLRSVGKMVLQDRGCSFSTSTSSRSLCTWANVWPALFKNWSLWNGELVSDSGHVPHSVMVCVMSSVKELERARVLQMQEVADYLIMLISWSLLFFWTQKWSLPVWQMAVLMHGSI